MTTTMKVDGRDLPVDEASEILAARALKALASKGLSLSTCTSDQYLAAVNEAVANAKRGDRPCLAIKPSSRSSEAVKTVTVDGSETPIDPESLELDRRVQASIRSRGLFFQDVDPELYMRMVDEAKADLEAETS